ncbi:MAG: choice-of-anchor Q domain-containing protein [Planctomycetota bacterium]
MPTRRRITRSRRSANLSGTRKLGRFAAAGRLGVESLEDRRLLSVSPLDSPGPSGAGAASAVSSAIVVTNTLDGGAGSLRDAIDTANATPGLDTITFDPAVFSTPQSIGLPGGTLEVSDALVLTGPGADLLTIFAGTDARHLTVDDGDAAREIDVTISGVTFTGSSLGNNGPPQPASGGAILNEENLTLDAVAVIDNSVTEAGAGLLNRGTVTITDSTFTDNRAGQRFAGGFGGGIANAGDAFIARTTIDSNFAFFFGGGIYNSGVMTVTQSTVSGNIGGEAAGGIENTGVLTVTETTISDNLATNFGGGVSNASPATLFVTQSTFADNVSSLGGPGIYNLGAATVFGSIFANATGGPAVNLDGTFSGAFNLVEDGSGTGLTGTIVAPAGIGGLADNGGPTATHALLPGSPAIDAIFATVGGSPADQRGLARVADGDGDGVARTDIGAFEAQAPIPPLAGDYNRDGVVNAADYTVWRDTETLAVDVYTGADGDGSAVIDAGDYDVWADRFGDALAAPATDSATAIGAGSARSTVTPMIGPIFDTAATPSVTPAVASPSAPSTDRNKLLLIDAAVAAPAGDASPTVAGSDAEEDSFERSTDEAIASLTDGFPPIGA